MKHIEPLRKLGIECPVNTTSCPELNTMVGFQFDAIWTKLIQSVMNLENGSQGCRDINIKELLYKIYAFKLILKGM